MSALASSILIVLSVAAGWSDLKSGRIPNAVTVPAMAVGLTAGAVSGGFPGLAASALGLVVGGATLVVPYLLGGMGAGDVKLAGAVGSISGVSFVLLAFANAALLGLLVAMIVLLRRKGLLETIGGFLRTARCLVRRLLGYPVAIPPLSGDQSTVLPFGALIAAGTILNLVTNSLYEGYLRSL